MSRIVELFYLIGDAFNENPPLFLCLLFASALMIVGCVIAIPYILGSGSPLAISLIFMLCGLIIGLIGFLFA